MATGELREALLRKSEAKPEKVPLPEFPEIGTIHVRRLWGSDFEEYQSIWPDDEGKKVSQAEFAAHMVALCVCDADGARVFQSTDKEAIAKTWHMSALLRVAAKAQRINGLGKATEETIEGNSETGQT
ncbi:MAG: hypothetical protein IT419_04840 [Planctomycetes bacterium]|nr:hypothetical protein [Planctomycetota bacterium]